MLSAYWGDPPGHRAAAKRAASAAVLAAFNDWFDHQSDRYGHVIAWALHHRRWMAGIAVASLRRRAGAAGHGRRLELPADVRRRHHRHRRAHAVRAPASNTPGCKVEEAATLARTHARDEGHQQLRERRAAGASTSTSARAPSASARAVEIAARAARAARAPGRRRVHGARRPQQRRAEAGADPLLRPRLAPAAWRSPATSWSKLQQGSGRGRRRPVGAGAARTSCKIELDRGLANALGISVGDAAQALRVAFAGVEVGRLGRPDRRDARRRGAPAPRRPRRRLATSSACRSPSAAPT